MRIRAARPDDAAAVADIYNAGIRERTSTFETRERAQTHVRHGQLEGEWRDVILVERSLAGQPTMG